jgi:hypothetical protein
MHGVEFVFLKINSVVGVVFCAVLFANSIVREKRKVNDYTYDDDSACMHACMHASMNAHMYLKFLNCTDSRNHEDQCSGLPQEMRHFATRMRLRQAPSSDGEGLGGKESGCHEDNMPGQHVALPSRLAKVQLVLSAILRPGGNQTCLHVHKYLWTY